MTKRLSDIVKVNPRFCRSINISQDLEDVDILKSFICPNSFRLALLSIANNVGATKQSAFTWVGPYGAGKSSLALLLSSLLSPKKYLRNLANELIGTDTAKNFNAKIKTKSGWVIMPIVGDVQDTQILIAKNIEKHTGKKSKDIFSDLKRISEKKDGLLLILDEMGKCLEAAAKGSGEIYFLQQLAEFALRSNGKIIFIGILHQAFAAYAKNLPHTMRDEWSKIEGRFANIPVNTGGEEQIELISRAITLTPKADKKTILKAIQEIAEQTVKTIQRNRVVISGKHLVDSLSKCWPINPVVVCLLSQISRKKFGQNQRSIFSFLASGEPYAFRDFVDSSNADTVYMPTNLFEYIKFNLESAIMASSESKTWHTAIDAIQCIQAKGLSEDHLDILKTIAMVDLFNGSSGLVADMDLIKKLYPSFDVQKIIEDLSRYSVIIFKKHKNAYSVFEGSDFDIEAALHEAYSNIIGLDVSKLEEIANFKPVIAKQYYHEYGAMRWFDVLLTGVSNYKEFLQSARRTSSAVGFFSILLPNSSEEEKQASKIVKETNNFNFPVIMTAAHNVRLINEYLRELLALEWIKRSNDLPGFIGDSIAQSIVDDRRRIIIKLLEVQLGEILSKSKWYRDGKLLGTISNDKLSALASKICKEQYPSAPKVKSELVNRTKPSGSANAALNALLKDMIINRGVSRLGIEGFSPEAGLFKILLQETGLYQSNGKLEFVYTEPEKGNHLRALWKNTDKFLTKNYITEAPEIFKLWSSQPFGVKAGLHNFFLLAYILTRENKVAVYRDGIYVPNITDTFVGYLVSNPKSISLKLVKSDNVSTHIMVSVIKALNEVNPKVKLSDNATPLTIAQKLVSVVLELHSWVLKTKTLEKHTIRLREVIKSANDPNKLLFEDLPKLYKINKLYESLKADLSELIDVYPTMIKSVGVLMMMELDILLPTSAHIERLRERAKNIKGVSGNFKLDAFASRLSTSNSSIADIAGIIGLANNKPQTEWIDLDIETAKKELMYLCNEFKKTELYSKIKDRPAARQAIAFIAGIGGNTEVVSEEFDLLIDKAKDVQKLKKQLEGLLSEQKDNALVLTALSEISIERIKNGKKQ